MDFSTIQQWLASSGWLEIIQEIFKVCIVPLLGVLTTAVVVFVKKKIAQEKAKTDSEITVKYLSLLETTVIDCIHATNQTYVEVLKKEDVFTKEAQQEALVRTTNAVKQVLSDDAKKYITLFVGDLDKYIIEKIEANIKK